MPNHITNVLHVSAYNHRGAETSQIDEVIAAIKSDASAFDFNRLVPMPAELQITCGSYTHDALALHDDAKAAQILRYPWAAEAGITTIDGIRSRLRERYAQSPETGFPTLDDFAARVRANIDRFGHTDWYQWSVDNWGTKWNAYEIALAKTHDNEVVIHFETAWSPPLPVLDVLAERFPKLSFRLIWCDEGDDRQHRVYWNDGKRDAE